MLQLHVVLMDDVLQKLAGRIAAESSIHHCNRTAGPDSSFVGAPSTLGVVQCPECAVAAVVVVGIVVGFDPDPVVAAAAVAALPVAAPELVPVALAVAVDAYHSVVPVELQIAV